MDCLFCKIANKEIEAQIIYEDEKSIALLDVNPLAPGHTLIIPKVHTDSIGAMPEADIGPLFLTVRKIADMLDDAFRPEGFTIGINQGPASRGGIEHLHIHVVPRWHADNGGSIHSIVHNPPKESLEEIKKKILNESH
ncbi:MAG: HIT family protein [Candidatus Colwellbacteria bacterium]|nr:HIT family protein [Candidatus Colwellbacteria bacterium]